MKLISIVIPVYNAEKYINRTLESIASQTYSHIEVILVDDGSTDASREICKKMVEKDDRFQYHRIKNSGPSNARNIGLSFAKGEYIGFCDSDDVISVDMYVTLVNYLETAHADIVLCDIYSERDHKKFGFPWKDGTVFEKDAVQDILMAAMIGTRSDNERGIPVWGSVVRCLYKSEILKKNMIYFPTDIHFAEDLVFTLRYLEFTNRAVICDQVLYHYTCNESSIMNSFYSYRPNMFEARIRLVNHIDDIINNSYNYNELRKRLTVTERCYYRECVGNACRPGKNRTGDSKIQELKGIVNHPSVRKAFKSFLVEDRKTKVVYYLIKKRFVILLYFYYYCRFQKRTEENL